MAKQEKSQVDLRRVPTEVMAPSEPVQRVITEREAKTRAQLLVREAPAVPPQRAGLTSWESTVLDAVVCLHDVASETLIHRRLVGGKERPSLTLAAVQRVLWRLERKGALRLLPSGKWQVASVDEG